ncbi:MAG TPA: hypothetical protein VHH36_06005 [Candidatus Thermoplasmatota archaeon]|nr:hypothetical protein [Candidatus Thermoplasmatota archaeon]
MGLLKIVWRVVAVLVLAAVFLGAYLYFTDYEAKATVTQRGQDSGGTYVLIKPDVLPYTHKAYLDKSTWDFVCEGYRVGFHVKSADYQVFDKDGELVYDSKSGETNFSAAARCATGNAGIPSV